MPRIGWTWYSATKVNFIGGSGDHTVPAAVNCGFGLGFGRIIQESRRSRATSGGNACQRRGRQVIPQQHVNEAIPATDSLQQSAPCGGVKERDKPQWQDSAGPEYEPQYEVLDACGTRHESGEESEDDPRCNRETQPIADG